MSLLGSLWKIGLTGGLLLTVVGGASTAEARPWRKIVTPRFTIITHASDLTTRRVATDFADFLLCLDQVMLVDPRELKPLTIVLFDNDSEYGPFKPLASNGQKIDDVAQERDMQLASTMGAGGSWAVLAVGAQDYAEQTRHAAFSGGVFWYLKTLDTPAPLAVERGIDLALAHMIRGVTHGELGETIPGFVSVLNTWQLMPVEKLLQQASYNQVVMSHGEVGFNAECWALIHYLMFAKSSVQQHAFAKFWLALKANATAHDALVRAIGADGAARIDTTLLTYIRNKRYTLRVTLGEQLNNHDPIAAADPLEVEIALARSAIAGNQLHLALAYADAAVAAAPDRPEPYDLRAELLAYLPNRESEHRAALAAAMSRGSHSANTLWRTAEYAWREAGDRKGSAAAARAAVNSAEKAANADMNFHPAFDLLAQALRYSDRVTDDDGRFLLYGRKRFPADRWILVGEAAFARKRGSEESAAQYETVAVSDDVRLDRRQRAAVQAFLSPGGDSILPALPADVDQGGTGAPVAR